MINKKHNLIKHPFKPKLNTDWISFARSFHNKNQRDQKISRAIVLSDGYQSS